MSDIHNKCRIVHALTDRAVSDLTYYLDKLCWAESRGWSPDTLQMIQMGNDAKELRAIADRIETVRKFMLLREAVS